MHDIDARRDLVFALLARQPSRAVLHPARTRGRNAGRRESVRPRRASRAITRFDALAAALALPVATEPHLVTFAPEGPWRGETHRVCDRPAGLPRLLEEVAAAGAEQVIIVVAGRRRRRGPHELSAGRADLRGRAGEPLAAFEAAALRDVCRALRRPVRRPVRHPARRTIRSARSTSAASTTSAPIASTPLAELVDRGYEDAYRQFIEPVVGGSGERIETVQ